MRWWRRDRQVPIAVPSADLTGPKFDDPPSPAIAATPAPLGERPMIRAGAYAWASIGVAIALVAALFVFSRLTVVLVPLTIALFPAAVLMPPTQALKNRGVPDAAAALLVLVVAFSLLGILVRGLAPQVSGEL